jgi:chemosensory pili system protein ChpC
VSDLRDELYSLLVPLTGERLIVPRACVAKVMSYQPPARSADSPPWYAGVVSWNARSVPIVYFEGTFGQPLPTPSSRTRILIFHATGGKLPCGFFGMLTQGFPRLVRVNAEVIRPDPSRSFLERSPVICQVSVANESSLIPDLQRLEQMIAAETSRGSDPPGIAEFPD